MKADFQMPVIVVFLLADVGMGDFVKVHWKQHICQSGSWFCATYFSTGLASYPTVCLFQVDHVSFCLIKPAPLPGLAAQGIDPQTGQFVDGYVVSTLSFFLWKNTGRQITLMASEILELGRWFG